MATTIKFGNAEIIVINHETRKQGLTHHKADIRLKGEINPVFMKNEVIDLVSKAMGFNPLRTPIRGARVVLDKGNHYYEVHWNTQTENRGKKK